MLKKDLYLHGPESDEGVLVYRHEDWIILLSDVFTLLILNLLLLRLCLCQAILRFLLVSLFFTIIILNFLWNITKLSVITLDLNLIIKVSIYFFSLKKMVSYKSAYLLAWHLIIPLFSLFPHPQLLR